MKIQRKNQANTNLDRVIVVGNRGTAFSLASRDAYPLGEDIHPRFPSPSSAGISFPTMGQLHGAGKACGIPAYDACLFVAGGGTPARLFALADALHAGAVTALDVTIDGGPAVVYVPGSWKQGHRLPKFLATPSRCGRVETRLVLPDRRNESYVGKVRLALVPPPKPAKPGKPAKAGK